MAEADRKALDRQKELIALDTFGGRIHVEWDPAAVVQVQKIRVCDVSFTTPESCRSRF